MGKNIKFILALLAALGPVWACAQDKVPPVQGPKDTVGPLVADGPYAIVKVSTRTEDMERASRRQFDVSLTTGAGGPPPVWKKYTLLESVEAMDLLEGSKKKTKNLHVYDGATGARNVYPVAISKGGHWRILWRIDATDEKARAIIVLRVDRPSPPGTEVVQSTDTIPTDPKKDPAFVQETIKEIGFTEGNAYGVMNICDTEGGDFKMTVDVKRAKWRVEVQAVQQ